MTALLTVIGGSVLALIGAIVAIVAGFVLILKLVVPFISKVISKMFGRR